jgi:hypothetical protein
MAFFLKKPEVHESRLKIKRFLTYFDVVVKIKNPVNQRFTGFCQVLICNLAVREGFEPSVQFPVRQFSKLILSASQAPHRIY